MMKISHSRIINSCGLVVGYTKWLPHGGEPYKLLIPHYAHWIAEMIQQCRTKYNGKFIKDFFNNINIDRGTIANPDTIRNALLYETKKILSIPQQQTTFTNEDGVEVNFQDWYINVCLFLCIFLLSSFMHIMHITCNYITCAFNLYLCTLGYTRIFSYYITYDEKRMF